MNPAGAAILSGLKPRHHLGHRMLSRICQHCRRRTCPYCCCRGISGLFAGPRNLGTESISGPRIRSGSRSNVGQDPTRNKTFWTVWNPDLFKRNPPQITIKCPKLLAFSIKYLNLRDSFKVFSGSFLHFKYCFKRCQSSKSWHFQRVLPFFSGFVCYEQLGIFFFSKQTGLDSSDQLCPCLSDICTRGLVIKKYNFRLFRRALLTCLMHVCGIYVLYSYSLHMLRVHVPEHKLPDIYS